MDSPTIPRAAPLGSLLVSFKMLMQVSERGTLGVVKEVGVISRGTHVYGHQYIIYPAHNLVVSIWASIPSFLGKNSMSRILSFFAALSRSTHSWRSRASQTEGYQALPKGFSVRTASETHASRCNR